MTATGQSGDGESALPELVAALLASDQRYRAAGAARRGTLTDEAVLRQLLAAPGTMPDAAAEVLALPDLPAEPAPPADGEVTDRLGPASGAVILRYRRIATAPPLEGVSADNLYEHFAVLRREWQPLPLAELARALRAGSLPERAVAVTFDNGYGDIAALAVPAARAAGVPVTVFSPAVHWGLGGEHWWDRLALLLLTGDPVPPLLRLSPGGRELVLPTRTLAERRAALARVQSVVRPLAAPAREVVLGSVAEWHGGTPPAPRTLSAEELRGIAGQPGVAIGVQPAGRLPDLAEVALRTELADSQAHLESILARPVTMVAYPDGDYDDRVLQAVRENGFAVGVTAEARPVMLDDDPLALPRLSVGDWSAGEFSRRLHAVAALAG
ncbi:MAG TPA: polysaccharide deacetylase family protein [bacterium]|nr:polysaccharide deacetylase family protein [bacterium]